MANPALLRQSKEVDERGHSNSHGARPVHLIITMIKWIRTNRLSIKNSLSLDERGGHFEMAGEAIAHHRERVPRRHLQGCLAHKKLLPPRTIQQDYA